MQALYTFFRARKVVEFWPCPIVFGLDIINYQLNISNAGFIHFFSGPKSCRVLALSYCFWPWSYQLSIEYIKCRLLTLFFGPEKLSSFGLVLLFLALVLSIIN